MKLDLSMLMQVDDAVAEECARYETADNAFILIFTLDVRQHNYLTLMPRPKDDNEYYGAWMDGGLPSNDRGEFLKRYSQEPIYESDDCFYAVYAVPSSEEGGFKTSVFLITPEDAYASEVELYTMKRTYTANVFNAYRCLIFPSLKAAIGSTYSY
ncbi:hypothetical protein GGH95_002340 [Coemansia sp. RSA 1836]|nr:hypothetical protein IWW47_004395 [Coemansia sp. RSA 2052]KAJ2580913.1 hypothetical protein GGH95_002340 [Coemansia sp. RSA 1836]